MAFSGIPAKTRDYLHELTVHNDKAWFEEHREDYETFYLEFGKQLVIALGPELVKLDPQLTADPRANKSIFRVHRDTRFSADKTPYRNHVDLWFYRGEDRKSTTTGFFLRIGAQGLVIGAGLHAFDKEMLPRYRQAVADIKRGSALEKAIATTLAADSNYKLGGQHYKTVPRGYDKEHPRAELLKHNGLHIMLECAYPTQAKSADFVPWVAEHMRQMLPMHRWIVGLIEDTAAK